MTYDLDLTVVGPLMGQVTVKGTVTERAEVREHFEPVPVGELVAGWVGALSTSEIERLALDRQSLAGMGDGGSYTADVVAVIQEMASGRPVGTAGNGAGL